MKSWLLTMVTFTLLNLLLLGLQANLYFLPFSPPAFWLVVLCYYCYSRSVVEVLQLNFILTLIMNEFSSIPPGPFIVVTNFIILLAAFIQNHFRLTDGQVLLSTAGASLIVNAGLWLLQFDVNGVFIPNIFAWVAASLATLAVSPVIFFPLRKFDQAICRPQSDSMEFLLV